jgi:hypothetical protein
MSLQLYSEDSWKNNVEIGNAIQARIVFIDHASKSIRLSCRPHVIDYRAPKYLPNLGTKINLFNNIIIIIIANNFVLTTFR